MPLPIRTARRAAHSAKPRSTPQRAEQQPPAAAADKKHPSVPRPSARRTVLQHGINQALVVVGLNREHAIVGALVLKALNGSREGGLRGEGAVGDMSSGWQRWERFGRAG